MKKILGVTACPTGIAHTYIINNLDMSNCKLLLNDILKLPSTKEIQLLLEDFYKNNLKY
ncbi:hypothetical protein ACAG39_00090 [Caldicellulosiruptoraceae bacterium PP1]